MKIIVQTTYGFVKELQNFLIFVKTVLNELPEI